jgi:ABC-type spermidine/putrescine transport system permease subunit I
MALAFCLILGVPAALWFAQQMYPQHRLMNGEFMSSYWLGVMVGMIALALAR